MIKKYLAILVEPNTFFKEIQEEGIKESLGFLVFISTVIAIFTPIVNFFGWPSTDTSSTFQAQILAWRITEEYLLPKFGLWGYVFEFFLIIGFTILLAVFLSIFIHLICKVSGGEGSILNGWKSVCYGVAPCVIFGWVPYWSLFMAAWSLILQFYSGPKTPYKLPEGRAIMILAFIVGATLVEYLALGTTVGFGHVSIEFFFPRPRLP